MNKLERLPEYTDSILHGLTADQALKHRILKEAAEQPKKKNILLFHAVPVLCSMIAVLLFAVVLLNELKPVSGSDQGEMTVFAAGSNQTASPETVYSFEKIIKETDSKTISRIEFVNGTVISEPETCAVLFSILKDKALPVDNHDLPESAVMTIAFSDGSSIQLESYPPLLTDGKKVWTCQAFFDAINDLPAGN